MKFQFENRLPSHISLRSLLASETTGIKSKVMTDVTLAHFHGF